MNIDCKLGTKSNFSAGSVCLVYSQSHCLSGILQKSVFAVNNGFVSKQDEALQWVDSFWSPLRPSQNLLVLGKTKRGRTLINRVLWFPLRESLSLFPHSQLSTRTKKATKPNKTTGHPLEDASERLSESRPSQNQPTFPSLAKVVVSVKTRGHFKHHQHSVVSLENRRSIYPPAN